VSHKRHNQKDSKRNHANLDLALPLQCVAIIISQTRWTTAMDILGQAIITHITQAHANLQVHLAMIRAVQAIHQVVAATKLTQPKLC